MEKMMSLTRPEEALQLSKGGLILGFIQVSFSTENVLEAAALLIEQTDAEDLVSQAGVIARAGKHGWGQGDVYTTTGSGDTHLAGPEESTAPLTLTKAGDALQLPKGRLIANMEISIEVSFSAEDVVDAAQLLIDKKDAAALATQAGTIARAGKHGWGQGDIYST